MTVSTCGQKVFVASYHSFSKRALNIMYEHEMANLLDWVHRLLADFDLAIFAIYCIIFTSIYFKDLPNTCMICLGTSDFPISDLEFCIILVIEECPTPPAGCENRQASYRIGQQAQCCTRGPVDTCGGAQQPQTITCLAGGRWSQQQVFCQTGQRSKTLLH